MTKFGHFVTYWQPLKPVQYWNRKLKLWVSERNKNCVYSSKHGAAVAAGHVRQRYSDSEIQRHIEATYLTKPEGGENA